jgi:hypothetical protein
MKRILVLLMVLGLVFGSIAAAEAGKKKKKPKAPRTPVKVERVVEVAYDHPGIGATAAGRGGGYPVTFPDPMDIPVTAEEQYIKVEIVDASGQKVAGSIGQGDVDGNGINDDLYGVFCGAHPEPIPLAAPGMPIIGIYAYSGTCEDGTTPSVMTSGTIKITLSNMP